MCQRDRSNEQNNKKTGSLGSSKHRIGKLNTKRMDRSITAIKECIATVHQLSQQILTSAWNGQRLPQLTLLWIAHLCFHVLLLYTLPSTDNRSIRLSTSLLILTTALLLSGYTLLVMLFRHSVQTIFNRNLPTLLKSIPSFGAHLAMLKPLDIIFRRFTAPLRVLPDILVLGEVRCGTTTLCQHLSLRQGAHTPFCLWKHPELDRKETFYFVGHYLGNVNPAGYRMCFPLQITKWIHTRILNRPFFTFEGCAQYMTSPTAPYLIAKTYKEAGLPPPILVACIRDPVDQATSWWRYENHAIQWGASMGLTEWNTTLRTQLSPPFTVNDAIDYSMSDKVKNLYFKAENLFQENDTDYILPPWAMTWPGGQLAGIGRNGSFYTNIQRYEKVFQQVFGQPVSVASLVPASSKLSFVNVVPLEYLKDSIKLSSTLTSLMQQVTARQSSTSPQSMVTQHITLDLHRNASVELVGMEPTLLEKGRLAKMFSTESVELETCCDIKLGWKIC